jgi:ATP-dependent RNA helicase RhlE
MSITFKDLGLHPSLMEGLDAIGFSKPTPIQELTIPHILAGKDIIGCAQTGTGKTAAYLLPIMSKLLTESRPHDQIGALVVAPTRELALQIDTAFQGFAYFAGLSSAAIYGGGDGQDFDVQKKILTSGTDVVIATPGKLISHLNLGYVKIDKLQALILDEADKMLDMGFYEDITKIISFLPKKRQTLLFSATMPPKIRELASKYLVEPEQVNIAISQPAEGVVQAAIMAHDRQKVPTIKHLLQAREMQSVIIFCSTKKDVKEIHRELKSMNFQAEAIHSDLEQSDRERVLGEFRNRKVKVLVATDIVARGIDIDDIEMVINYNLPRDAEDYIHRIGRTARGSSKGIAFTFVNEDDLRGFHKIEAMVEKEIKKVKVPSYIGEGPAYYTPDELKGMPSYGRGHQKRRFSGQKSKPRNKTN